MPEMLRRVEDELGKILRRRTRTDAEMRPTRVESRNTDGTLQMRRQDGECIARTNVCALRIGQIVDVPCSAPFKMAGAAGIPAVRVSRAVDVMEVESLDPSVFQPGTSETVTVTGRGFRPISVFEFLSPESDEVNPDITIDSSTYVSATEFTLEITVASDAALIVVDGADLAFDNPGTPL